MQALISFSQRKRRNECNHKCFFIITVWGSGGGFACGMDSCFMEVFGNYIRYGLSVIPFLLRLLFRLLYWIVEIPVTTIHSKFGSIFLAKLENKMSTVGEHIDYVIGCWYSGWHTNRKIEFKKCLIVYLVCIAIVLVPFYMNINNDILEVGQTLYTRGEMACVNWLEEHKWYDPKNQKEIT